MRIVRAKTWVDDPGHLAFFSLPTGLIYFSSFKQGWFWKRLSTHPLETIFPRNRRNRSEMRKWLFL